MEIRVSAEIDEEAGGKAAFGRWLLTQDKRTDWVGDLAKAAKADRGFPRDGDAEAVRARMREQQADGDAWSAIDDAEDDWLCL
jgi:hypothetical protein